MCNWVMTQMWVWVVGQSTDTDLMRLPRDT